MKSRSIPGGERMVRIRSHHLSGACLALGVCALTVACGSGGSNNETATTGPPASQGTAPVTDQAKAPASQPGAAESIPMGGEKSVTRFFVTSRGLGKGGDLGGLAGADAHCQALAKAEGSGDHTWRAYLSTQAKDG